MIKGKVIHEPGPGSFGAPHGIAVDSEGSFYVAEVGETFLRIDRRDRSVQKFVRV
jgi:streptogramin lyase